MRTHFPDTIHSNLQEKHEASLIFWNKGKGSEGLAYIRNTSLRKRQ